MHLQQVLEIMRCQSFQLRRISWKVSYCVSTKGQYLEVAKKRGLESQGCVYDLMVALLVV